MQATPLALLRETNVSLRSVIDLLDSKISVLTAATVGSMLFAVNLLRNLSFDRGPLPPAQVILFSLLIGAWSGCGGALCAALASLWARTPGTHKGVTSFIAIKWHGENGTYEDTVLAMDEKAIVGAMATLNFDLSRIVTQKVRWVNRAIMFLVIGLFFTAASVIEIAVLNSMGGGSPSSLVKLSG